MTAPWKCVSGLSDLTSISEVKKALWYHMIKVSHDYESYFTVLMKLPVRKFSDSLKVSAGALCSYERSLFNPFKSPMHMGR